MAYTPISVVIITFNEEKNIARCINSVKDIADDILVLDSNSTDNTENIAIALGARVVSQPFLGHIQQKNKAIELAKYPHVLSLDADEKLDETSIEQIKIIKNNFIADGYSLNRLNNYCGKWIRHGAWYPDIKLRLWYAPNGAWTGLNPHDRFEMKEGSNVQHLEGNILHYSYADIASHRNKIKYFSDIAAKSYYQAGKRSSIIKIWFSPVVRFLRDYIIKMGFMDGLAGLQIAFYTAKEVKMKYEKLFTLQRQK